ncbi:MAG: peptidoglycan editing factor PgeF [Hyphomicrobiaceae bacterium]
MLAPIIAPCLEGAAIRHGFFNRHGGVSQGIYASLNCGLGSRDETAAVRENRARVAAHLQAASLLTAHQIHSPTVVVVTEPWPHAERPRADALVTATRGIALGVLAADCTPVLFADPVAGVVAAAHAGWRGAIGGVLESAIAGMEGLGARRQDIRAAVGPCIGPDSYEVGWDFERDFLGRDADSRPFFSRPSPVVRPHFDLPGYALHRLRRAGLGHAASCTVCTYSQTDDFFSYRRSQARGDVDYGRQISAIVLT